MIRLEKHTAGARLYIHTWRIHHGRIGLALTILGIALAAHDRHDYPWPTQDP